MDKTREVLLVEEDPEVVEYLSTFIPLLGSYKVVQAFEGMEALAKINALEPELVILDLSIPKIDTSHLLREIREKHRETKVLIITSKPPKEELGKRGAQEVITKPFDLSELSQKVKELLPADEKPPNRPEYARLLIVDDEPEIDEFLKNDLFMPLGVEVYTACDGEEALRIFKKTRCNLVILDLKMPKMNGEELIRRLETSVDPPKPKVIMVTTSALGDPVDDLKRLGYSILAKPLDLPELEKNIIQACEKFNLALKK